MGIAARRITLRFAVHRRGTVQPGQGGALRRPDYRRPWFAARRISSQCLMDSRPDHFLCSASVHYLDPSLSEYYGQ